MIIDIENDPRHAGRVRRFHTWPTITTQSVAEHTWQVMRIMMTIDAGMCTTKLMQYAVLHDVGEMAGDIPWPGKRNSINLKSAMDAAEQIVRFNMKDKWGQPTLPELTEIEKCFFKLCENIEMWEFGLQEVSMGNKYGVVIAARMLLAAGEYLTRLPPETQSAARQYIERRTSQESEVELVDVHDPRHSSHRLDPSCEVREFVNREEKR